MALQFAWKSTGWPERAKDGQWRWLTKKALRLCGRICLRRTRRRMPNSRAPSKRRVFTRLLSVLQVGRIRFAGWLQEERVQLRQESIAAAPSPMRGWRLNPVVLERKCVGY